MRYYLICFSVAIFAFGLGILSTFNFFSTTDKLETQIQESKVIDVKVINTERPIAKKENKPTRFVCEDAQLRPVWKKMMNSQSFKAYMDIRNDSNLGDIDCAKEFEVKLIDVNNDGIKELAVQGKWSHWFCGMYSGCSFWLFKRNKQNYETLLTYGDAFDYKLGKKQRSGFREVILRENGGNYGARRYFYKFNGIRYKANRCFLDSFDYFDRNGQLQTGEKLNITREDCPAEEN